MWVILEKVEAKVTDPTNVDIDFKITGQMVKSPVIGDRCVIVQCVGDIVVGYFMTSRVIEVLDDGIFHTLNSVYRYTEVVK